MTSQKNHACCVYDFTLFDEIDVSLVRSTLLDLCKKYCFQLECGEETKRNHYQGRMSLKCKKREHELVKMLQMKWQKFHISVTSTANRDNNFYVMKEDTRVSGPFTDENDIYIPKDIREISSLYQWQTSLLTELKKPSSRLVDIVYEPVGCVGKTIFTRWAMIYDNFELLPHCTEYRDIMRMVYDIGSKQCYLIDMPRAINKKKLGDFFAGIETVKGGYCYDDRYGFKRRLFDPPRVCVFTNTLPDLDLLSGDRWQIWTIEDNQLYRYGEMSNVKRLLRNKPKKYEVISDDNDDNYIDPFILKTDQLSESE